MATDGAAISPKPKPADVTNGHGSQPSKDQRDSSGILKMQDQAPVAPKGSKVAPAGSSVRRKDTHTDDYLADMCTVF